RAGARRGGYGSVRTQTASPAPRPSPPTASPAATSSPPPSRERARTPPSPWSTRGERRRPLDRNRRRPRGPMKRSGIARRQLGSTSIRLAAVLALTLALGLVLVPTASALRFTDDSYLVPDGTVGEYYAHQFTGEGGGGLPYQFRVLSGALPPGLSLTGDGLLVGIPTLAGSWSFWLELSDEDPPSEPWCIPKKSQRRFTVDVVAALVITTGAPAPATLGTPYS